VLLQASFQPLRRQRNGRTMPCPTNSTRNANSLRPAGRWCGRQAAVSCGRAPLPGLHLDAAGGSEPSVPEPVRTGTQKGPQQSDEPRGLLESRRARRALGQGVPGEHRLRRRNRRATVAPAPASTCAATADASHRLGSGGHRPCAFVRCGGSAGGTCPFGAAARGHVQLPGGAGVGRQGARAPAGKWRAATPAS
jgi:hypothetical protein